MVRFIGLIAILPMALCASIEAAISEVVEASNSAGASHSPEASNATTPFADNRPLSLPSPDGRYRLVSEADESGLVRLVAISGQGKAAIRDVIGTYEAPASVLWSPRSNAFILNDQRGSGQTSYLEIVRLSEGRFHRDITARRNLSHLYNSLFGCELPEEAIVTSGQAWLNADHIVVEVQATLHSGGCPLDPFATNTLTLIVDARTGEVLNRPPEQP